jgi:cytochrome c peroxidase
LVVLLKKSFERFRSGHDASALNAPAQRGLVLFTGRAQCASCHLVDAREAALTDGRFHSVGVGLGDIAAELPVLVRRVVQADEAGRDRLVTRDPAIAALGRFVVNRDPASIGAFRTPDLRNVALTAPYMHDGSVPTLEEAVEREVYYRGQKNGQVIALTAGERQDLVAFLQALSSPDVPAVAERARRWARAGDER